jgi:hypothetical protein
MQRKEIKTGELLAYRAGASGGYRAAIVLDTSTLWEHSVHRFNNTHTWKRTEATRPGRRGGGSYDSQWWGLLAFVAESTYDTDKRDHSADEMALWFSCLDDPHTLTPETVAALAKETPGGARLTVIEPRQLHGRWRPVVAAYDRREAAEAAEREHQRAERERLRGVYDQALTAWQARFGADSGFTYDSYSDGAPARVPLEQLAELLGVTDPK